MASPSPVQPIFFGPIERALSKERLAGYRLAAADTPRQVVGRYLWNDALCTSVYSSLHFLEVSFRNHVHDALAGWVGLPAWYDATPSFLSQREAVVIRETKASLTHRAVPPIPGRVVAKLNFGFWTSLLSAEYEQKLWPRLLKPVFPGMPRTARTRHVVAARMHGIRQFRNRVFHYEPI